MTEPLDTGGVPIDGYFVRIKQGDENGAELDGKHWSIAHFGKKDPATKIDIASFDYGTSANAVQPTTNSGDNLQLAEPSGNVWTYEYLKAETSYIFDYMAINAVTTCVQIDQSRTLSEQIDIKTLALSPPSPPRNVRERVKSAEGNTVQTGGALSITWDRPFDSGGAAINSYRVAMSGVTWELFFKNLNEYAADLEMKTLGAANKKLARNNAMRLTTLEFDIKTAVLQGQNNQQYCKNSINCARRWEGTESKPLKPGNWYEKDLTRENFQDDGEIFIGSSDELMWQNPMTREWVSDQAIHKWHKHGQIAQWTAYDCTLATITNEWDYTCDTAADQRVYMRRGLVERTPYSFSVTAVQQLPGRTPQQQIKNPPPNSELKISKRSERLQMVTPAATAPGFMRAPYLLKTHESNSGGMITVYWHEPIDTGGNFTTAYYSLIMCDEDGDLSGVRNAKRCQPEETGGLGLYVEIYRGPHLYYSQGGLKAGHRYNFRVSAINAVGEGPYSTKFPIDAKGETAPGPIVAPFAHYRSGGIMEVRWLPPKDTGGIKITSFVVSYWTLGSSEEDAMRLHVTACNVGPVLGLGESDKVTYVEGSGCIPGDAYCPVVKASANVTCDTMALDAAQHVAWTGNSALSVNLKLPVKPDLQVGSYKGLPRVRMTGLRSDSAYLVRVQAINSKGLSRDCKIHPTLVDGIGHEPAPATFVNNALMGHCVCDNDDMMYVDSGMGEKGAIQSSLYPQYVAPKEEDETSADAGMVVIANASLSTEDPRQCAIHVLRVSETGTSTAPTMPRALKVTPSTGGELRLAWEAPEDRAGGLVDKTTGQIDRRLNYEVFCTDGTGESNLTRVWPGRSVFGRIGTECDVIKEELVDNCNAETHRKNQLHFYLRGLNPKTSYSCGVKAMNGIGLSPMSEVVEVRTLGVEKPGKTLPPELLGGSGSGSEGALDLMWKFVAENDLRKADSGGARLDEWQLQVLSHPEGALHGGNYSASVRPHSVLEKALAGEVEPHPVGRSRCASPDYPMDLVRTLDGESKCTCCASNQKMDIVGKCVQLSSLVEEQATSGLGSGDGAASAVGGILPKPQPQHNFHPGEAFCCCSLGMHAWPIDTGMRTDARTGEPLYDQITTNLNAGDMCCEDPKLCNMNCFPTATEAADGSTIGLLAYRQDSLRRSTKYQVRIRARNEAGYGPWSEKRIVETNNLTVVPKKPVSGCLSNDYVQLQMEEPAPVWMVRIDGFSIWAKCGNEDEYTRRGTTSFARDGKVGALSYKLGGGEMDNVLLKQATKCKVVVHAVNTTCHGRAWSDLNPGPGSYCIADPSETYDESNPLTTSGEGGRSAALTITTTEMKGVTECLSPSSQLSSGTYRTSEDRKSWTISPDTLLFENGAKQLKIVFTVFDVECDHDYVRIIGSPMDPAGLYEVLWEGGCYREVNIPRGNPRTPFVIYGGVHEQIKVEFGMDDTVGGSGVSINYEIVSSDSVGPWQIAPPRGPVPREPQLLGPTSSGWVVRPNDVNYAVIEPRLQIPSSITLKYAQERAENTALLQGSSEAVIAEAREAASSADLAGTSFQVTKCLPTSEVPRSVLASDGFLNLYAHASGVINVAVGPSYKRKPGDAGFRPSDRICRSSWKATLRNG